MATRKKSIIDIKSQFAAIASHPNINPSRMRKVVIARDRYIGNIHRNANYMMQDEYEHRTGQDYDDLRPSQVKKYQYRGERVPQRSSIKKDQKDAARLSSAAKSLTEG